MKNTLHNVRVTPTNRPFIVNGKSDYKIVIPQNAGAKISQAVSFLAEHLYKATNCLLDIEYEAHYAWTPDTKAIFLGREDVFEQAGLQMPDADLTASGY